MIHKFQIQSSYLPADLKRGKKATSTIRLGSYEDFIEEDGFAKAIEALTQISRGLSRKGYKPLPCEEPLLDADLTKSIYCDGSALVVIFTNADATRSFKHDLRIQCAELSLAK